MGMFDEVHTGVRCGQTKALGKGGGFYLPGSPAQVIPAPMNDEQLEQYMRGGLAPVAASAQIAMHEGGFLTLRDGVLIGWDDERDPSLPLFTNLGQPTTVEAVSGNYLYAHMRALQVTVDGVSARRSEDELLDRLFGELSPAERAEREAARRAEEVGEPVDCSLCERIRDGQGPQLLAERAARRRRDIDDLS